MKKRILVGFVFALAILSTAGSSHLEATPTTAHDTEKLAVMNMHFAEPIGSAKIDKETAITNAKNAFPGPDTESTQISVEYHLVTHPGYNAFSVWELHCCSF